MAACLKRYIPLFLLTIFFVRLGGEIGHAADAPADKPATCGGYTYTLPEGFTELIFHREFSEAISISEINEKLPVSWRSAIICIIVENKRGRDFIVSEMETLIVGSEHQKNPIRIYPKKYETELPDSVCLYTFDNLYHSETEMDFSQYLLDLKAFENEANVLLYVLDETFCPISKDDPRTLEQVAADANRPKKERAMRLINSVRRRHE